ncbi:protein ORF112 [Lake sturgeon herpesvirus]|nr:protein ORF112 [Lake sturgeon herpesvirus]
MINLMFIVCLLAQTVANTNITNITTIDTTNYNISLVPPLPTQTQAYPGLFKMGVIGGFIVGMLFSVMCSAICKRWCCNSKGSGSSRRNRSHQLY